MYSQFLKLISADRITLLKDINRAINIDKSDRSRYFMIPNFEIKLIKEFILTLDEESLYSIIPIISISARTSDPYITLGNTILVSSYSNYVIVNDYLLDRFKMANNQFNTNFENYYLLFKYKKVLIDLNHLNSYRS
jgi:predicted metallo-beta-lactamase superfamily hydrolase